MSVTAAEVKEAVDKYNENMDSRWEQAYEELHGGSELEIPGLGTLHSVASYGGEGQGDDYWVVFKLGDQMFRVDGWYASYDGGELDGDPYEVVAKEVSSIAYVKA